MSNMSEYLQRLALKLTRKAAAKTIILEALIEVYEDEELIEYMEAINYKIGELSSKIDAVIQYHFKVGMNHLVDARNSRYVANRTHSLREAKSEFMIASHIDSPFVRALSKFYVGACHQLLGERKNAYSAYIDAYNAADDLRIKLERNQSSSSALLEVKDLLRSLSIAIAFFERGQIYYVEVGGRKRQLKRKCPDCGWITIISIEYCPLCDEDLLQRRLN